MDKYCLGEIRAKTDRVPGCPEQKALMSGHGHQAMTSAGISKEW
ncbi:MAG: hypothetical protein PVJ14_02475 [Chromatiales bacterium]|jgi:putative salt-induced outer membrane protein YdiY